jgi:hypothetical protein
MILFVSGRTDIPAFYAEWFMKRVRAGFVDVRNPYYGQQVTRYKLTPDLVDCLVFCTKNPAPMLPYLEELQSFGFGLYFFVTITPYGKDIEPHVPDKDHVLDTFCKLSGIVGKDSIGWRYDPILIDHAWTIERHIEAFSHMAAKLSGYTHTAVISFIDLYEKVKLNYPEIKRISSDNQHRITASFVRIARTFGMSVKPCGEDKSLESLGADCSGCMTVRTFETAIGQNLKVPPNPNNRRECACYLTGDIGAYNTCGHFCRYCYANAE